MEDLIFIYTMLGVLFGFIVVYYFANPYRRVGFIRKFSSKNLGIIRFRSNGKSEFPVIVDFDKDIVRRADGIWILDKMKIFRQVGDEKVLHKEIDVKKASFNQGCPIINLDWNDMIPLGLEHENIPQKISRSPQQVESALRKERAAIEAEVLMQKNKEIKSIKNMCTIAAVICIVGVAISMYLLMQINQLGPVVIDIQNKVFALVNNLTVVGG